MDRDNFFDNLRREDTAQDELRRQQRQLAYEERVIKRVFSECGIKITGWGLLANMCRHETAQDKLNFGWFNTEFSRFPGRLCGRRIPRLHEFDFQTIFKPIEKNRLVKAVAKARAKDEITGEDIGWVFVFPVVRTFFCAHNLDLDIPGITFSLRDDDRHLKFAVSPSKDLFQAVGKDWFSI
jgi:hypothetical protein